MTPKLKHGTKLIALLLVTLILVIVNFSCVGVAVDPEGKTNKIYISLSLVVNRLPLIISMLVPQASLLAIWLPWNGMSLERLM